METQYPNALGDFVDETTNEKQYVNPLGDFVDSEASGGPGPGPSSNRRPVVIMCGE